jgi:hypothetical protein
MQVRHLGLTLAILCAPLAAGAQIPAKIPHISYLWIGAEGSDSATRPGLQQGLRELGYHEGRDIVVEYRYADSSIERLRELVSDMVAGNVEDRQGARPRRAAINPRPRRRADRMICLMSRAS